MRGPAALQGRRFGGADVHVPVGLAAIGVDDLALETPGQGHRQPGLTHASGTNNQEEGCGIQGHVKREPGG